MQEKLLKSIMNSTTHNLDIDIDIYIIELN